MNTAARPFFSRATLSDLTLRVHDAERMLTFYRDQLGLREIGRSLAGIALSADGSAPALVNLVEDSAAPARPPGTTGLFHLALLLPDRAALATAVLRLLDLGVPCHGASDHGVSEAFYFADPEGNGVELYADKPAADWPRSGADVAMGTHSLDARALLALGRPEHRQAPLPPTTRLGHVHLSVADLAAAAGLFVNRLGLTVRQRDYPGALFLGYDGYHHHIAVNTWRGRLRPPVRALGLIGFTLRYARSPESLPAHPSDVAAGYKISGSRDAITLTPVEQSAAD